MGCICGTQGGLTNGTQAGWGGYEPEKEGAQGSYVADSTVTLVPWLLNPLCCSGAYAQALST